MTHPRTAPQAGEVIEVAEGVLWARLSLPFRLDHVNIYFLRAGDAWLIFDAGLDTQQARAEWEMLLTGPLRGARFAGLIASHSHPDHIGLAGWLCAKLDIPLWTTRSSFFGATMAARAPDFMASPEYGEVYRRHGLPEEVATIVTTRGHEYLSMISPLPVSFRRLHLNQDMPIGDRRFRVMEAEGHCDGQIMLHDAEGALLLAADHIIEKISPNVSIQPYEPEADPLGAFLQSHRAMQTQIAEETLVLSGHHLPLTDPHRRAAELLDHHDNRLSLLLDHLAKGPHSAADLVPVMFHRPLTPHEMSFAFTEVLAHLNHLVRRGEVRWLQGQNSTLAERL